jgi:hypothetical protein
MESYPFSSLRSAIKHPWHNHPLTKNDVDNGWACDGRLQPGGCLRGITGFRQTAGVPRYRCAECDFDLCDKCVEIANNSPGEDSQEQKVAKLQELLEAGFIQPV